VVRDHVARAHEPAGLLVGRPEKHDVGGERGARTLQRDHRHQLRDREPFHVDGAAAPDIAVLALAAERVDGPVAGVRGHDVHVIQQDHGGPGSVPLQPRKDARAARRGFVDLGRDALLSEQLLEELGRADLVAGRVRRVHAQIVDEDAEGLESEGIGFGGLRAGRQQAGQECDAEAAADGHGSLSSGGPADGCLGRTLSQARVACDRPPHERAYRAVSVQ
jgi:hypothetical protein